jgi:hypothetical protein
MDPASAVTVGTELWKVGGIAAFLLGILVFGGWLMFRFFVDLVKGLSDRLNVVQDRQTTELAAVVQANTKSNDAVAASCNQMVAVLRDRPCLIETGKHPAQRPGLPHIAGMALAFVLLLSGCGSKREEFQRQERQDQTDTKVTTVREMAGVDTDGKPYTETETTTAFSQALTTGETASEIHAQTTLEAPELKAAAVAIGGLVANVTKLAGQASAFVSNPAPAVAGGIGAALSGLAGWLTGTPEGAGTGLATALAVAGIVRRGINGERRLKESDRDFDAVVKGNSDFMQANTEAAPLLKAHQSKAMDAATKKRVRESRLRQGLS